MTIAELMVPVMNLALVLGVGLVMPIAFRRRFTPWLMSALGVSASLVVAPGVPAAVVVLPWVALALRELLTAVRRRRLARLFLGGFSLTAALALIASRLEFTLFDIREPIVKLTALHFTFAGVGTLSLANRLIEQRASTSRRLVGLLVMGAPPVVALGFITRLGVFQVGGAVLMAVGVFGVAVPLWREAMTRQGLVRGLLVVASLAPWVAMALGVSWAANQYWHSVPALSVPDMVPTHGALNAFGFVLCGHLAWWREDPDVETSG